MTKFEKVGVVGAGVMGSGIAQKFAQEQFNVVLLDIKEEMVEKGITNIRDTLDQGVKRNILSTEDVEDIMSRIEATTNYEHVSDADLVVEAVYEDKQIKTNVFHNLDKVCSINTVLATNTSSLRISDLKDIVTYPERFIGLHYFYHPAMNRLLEVIPHDGTSEKVVNNTLLFAKLHGKIPILAKDTTGFIVNRFFVPFLNEACRILEENITNIPTIEEATKQAFNIPMGPFELMNVTGIPIAAHSSKTFGRAFGSFYETANILEHQVEKKELWDLSGTIDYSKIDVVKNRLLGVCLGVAATIVDDGVATKEDVDRGAKIGLRWKNGPFEIMNQLGIQKVYSIVEEISNKYNSFDMPSILKHQKEIDKAFTLQFIDYNVTNDVGYVTINRPEAMNALNETIVEQIKETLEYVENDKSINKICFQGNGKTFIGGADIQFFVDKIKNNNLNDIVNFTRFGHQLLLKLENSSKLTVSILDGMSLGGGSEFCLACNGIVATQNGSMVFPETGIGIYPGLGGMIRLSRCIGKELTKYYVLTGDKITAEDAYELCLISNIIKFKDINHIIENESSKKLINRCSMSNISNKYAKVVELFSKQNIQYLLNGNVPPGSDNELAPSIIKKLNKKAPLALQFANRIIDEQENKSIEEAIEIELNYLPEIFSSYDAFEGLSASLENRRPVFKGK